MKTCSDCNGDGVVDKDTDDERQCPTCGGLGFVPDDHDDHEEVIKTSCDLPQSVGKPGKALGKVRGHSRQAYLVLEGHKRRGPGGGNPPGTSLAACPATTRNTMQGPRSNNIIGRRDEESPARFEPDRASRSMSMLGHRGAERCLVWRNQAQEAYTHRGAGQRRSPT
jgi:hypothetical protein